MERRRPVPLVASGGVDLILFCWERLGRTDLLVMVCKGVEGKMEAIAVQPGPNDDHSLILRAGPDAATLRTQKAILFGAGALGGHTATLPRRKRARFFEVSGLRRPPARQRGETRGWSWTSGRRQGGSGSGRNCRARPLDGGDLFPRSAQARLAKSASA